jgi:hypothetical protein
MLATATRLGVDITDNSPHSLVVTNVVSTINDIEVNAFVFRLIPISTLTSATDCAEVSIISDITVGATPAKTPRSVDIIIIIIIITIIIIIIIIFSIILSPTPASITTITTFAISSIIIINNTLYTMDTAWMADGPGLGTDSTN